MGAEAGTAPGSTRDGLAGGPPAGNERNHSDDATLPILHRGRRGGQEASQRRPPVRPEAAEAAAAAREPAAGGPSSSSAPARRTRFLSQEDATSAYGPSDAYSPSDASPGSSRSGGRRTRLGTAAAGAVVAAAVAAGLCRLGGGGAGHRLLGLLLSAGTRLAARHAALSEALGYPLVTVALAISGSLSGAWIGVRARRRQLKRLASLSNHCPFQIHGSGTSVDETMMQFLQSNYVADHVQSSAKCVTMKSGENGRLAPRRSWPSASAMLDPAARHSRPGRHAQRTETEKSWFDYMVLDAAQRPDERSPSSSSSSSADEGFHDPSRGKQPKLEHSPREESAEVAIAHTASMTKTGEAGCGSESVCNSDPRGDSARLKELAFRMPSWNFDIFEVEQLTPRPLSFIGFVCLDAYSKLVQFEKPKLLEFLNDVEGGYRKVPYHNSLHGACVARMVYSFCTGCGLSFSQENMEFTLVLAGLVHDVHHPGLSAPFLTSASAGGRPWKAPLAPPLEPADMELASKYNDQSPLENMHCAVTFELLRREKNAFLPSEDITAMSKPLIRAILGTDMAKHAEHLTRLVALIDNLEHGTPGTGSGGIPWYWPATPPAGADEEQRQAWQLRLQEEFVMELFLHAADIGNATLPFTQWCRWNRLVQQEFHTQGDMEILEFGALVSAPAGYDRNATMLAERNFTKGFMDHLVKPFYDRLGDLTAINAAGSVAGGVNIQCCLGNLRKNLKLWDERTELERSADRQPGTRKSDGDSRVDDWAADDSALTKHSRRRTARRVRGRRCFTEGHPSERRPREGTCDRGPGVDHAATAPAE